MDDHDDERPEPRGPVVTEDLVKSVKGVTGCDDATAARLLRAAHGDADAAAAMFFDDMNDGDDAFDDDYDDEARGDGDSVSERRAAAGMDGARDAAAEGGAADDEEASAIDSILGLARKAGPADGEADYAYDERLERVFGILRDRNPDLTAEKTKTIIKPPQVER